MYDRGPRKKDEQPFEVTFDIKRQSRVKVMATDPQRAAILARPLALDEDHVDTDIDVDPSVEVAETRALGW